MLTKDYLADGSVRLKAGNCGFLFTRLSVGVIYTRVYGTDTGGLGSAPLEELAAEFTRFKVPLIWFVDAENAPAVIANVREQWTAWLLSHQNLFEKIHVMTAGRPMQLTMEVAKHFSNMQRLMVNHYERKSFDQALLRSTDASVKPVPDWFSVEPTPLKKTVELDGTVAISNNRSEFTIKRMNERTIWTTIHGMENGSLSNTPFDHMQSELNTATKKITWFLDCGRVTTVDPRVLEAWIRWAVAHENQIDTLHMYVRPGALPLLIDIAAAKSNARKLITLHCSKEAFNRVCTNNDLDTVVA